MNVLNNVRFLKCIRFKPVDSTLGSIQYDAWPSPFYQLISFSLSCLMLNKFYDNIHVYTDKEGKQFLETQLKLPFKGIHLLPEKVLPHLDKFYILSIQDQPSFFIENDVFIHKPLPLKEIVDSIFVLCTGDNQSESYMLASDIHHVLNWKGKLKYYDFNTSVLGGAVPHFFKSLYAELIQKEDTLKKIAEPLAQNYLMQSYWIGDYAAQNNITISALFQLPEFIQYPYKILANFNEFEYFNIKNEQKNLVETLSNLPLYLKSLNESFYDKILNIRKETIPKGNPSFFLLSSLIIDNLIWEKEQHENYNEEKIESIISKCQNEHVAELLSDCYHYEKSKKDFLDLKRVNKKELQIHSPKSSIQITAETLELVIRMNIDVKIIDCSWDWQSEHKKSKFQLLKIMYNLRTEKEIHRKLLHYSYEKEKLLEKKLLVQDMVLFEVLNSPKSVSDTLKEAIKFFKKKMDNDLVSTFNAHLINRINYWVAQNILEVNK